MTIDEMLNIIRIVRGNHLDRLENGAGEAYSAWALPSKSSSNLASQALDTYGDLAATVHEVSRELEKMEDRLRSLDRLLKESAWE